ncbi:MAG: hypothetical protein V4592_14900 [Bacteroidota bacterium]
MLTKLLLPHRFKRIGWWLTILTTITAVMLFSGNYQGSWLDLGSYAFVSRAGMGAHHVGNMMKSNANIFGQVVAALLALSLLLVAFSKEKMEDEYIATIRSSAMIWAIWANYLLIFLIFLLVYGPTFVSLMLYNIFTVLILFIARFHYLMNKAREEEIRPLKKLF